MRTHFVPVRARRAIAVWLLPACILGFFAATIALAADPTETPSHALHRDTVVATVGGKAIQERQVELMFAAATHGQVVPPEAIPRMRAAILLQLVDRQIAESYLDQAKLTATPEEIDAEVTHLKTELDHAKKTLTEYLARTGQSETMLRSEIGWGVSWKKFLKQQVTDEALEAYFKAHQRDFDGTELRVSHILLRPTVAGDDSAVATLVKEAEQIRKQIQAGEITFEAAAEKYSAGPSRHRGGDLGFIPRHGLMVEPFARAAFALDKDQISPPVASVFGIHLIRVTDIKPGDKKWTDVRDALQAVIDARLFEQLVGRQRDKVSVQYSGNAPYFKPGTTELVVPK